MGQKIDIYWPLDKQSYPATITKISLTDVEVEYDDGMTKTYPLSAVLASMSAAKYVAVRPTIECVFQKKAHVHICTSTHMYTPLIIKYLRI